VSVSGHHRHQKALIADMLTRRNPTPDPVDTVQAEFVKISDEEVPLPLTRIVIVEEALNPILFKTPIVESPFLTPLLHPIGDAFHIFMRDLRAKDKDDQKEFVEKEIICNIMYIIYPATGTTEYTIEKVQFHCHETATVYRLQRTG
jgi:hypothetical protein